MIDQSSRNRVETLSRTLGRCSAIVALMAGLSACESVPDELNPGVWFEEVAGTFDEDETPPEAETAQQGDYPNLGTVPDKPEISIEERRQALSRGLVSDDPETIAQESNRMYSNETLEAESGDFSLRAPDPSGAPAPMGAPVSTPVPDRPGQSVDVAAGMPAAEPVLPGLPPLPDMGNEVAVDDSSSGMPPPVTPPSADQRAAYAGSTSPLLRNMPQSSSQPSAAAPVPSMSPTQTAELPPLPDLPPLPSDGGGNGGALPGLPTTPPGTGTGMTTSSPYGSSSYPSQPPTPPGGNRGLGSETIMAPPPPQGEPVQTSASTPLDPYEAYYGDRRSQKFDPLPPRDFGVESETLPPVAADTAPQPMGSDSLPELDLPPPPDAGALESLNDQPQPMGEGLEPMYGGPTIPVPGEPAPPASTVPPQLTPQEPLLARRTPAPAAMQGGASLGAAYANVVGSRFPHVAVSYGGRPAARAGSLGPVPGEVRLGTIYFADGSAALGRDDRKVLKQIAQIYKQYSGRLRVVGHASHPTKARSAKQHNLINYRISGQRSDQVARALVRLGIPRNQIKVSAVADNLPEYMETRSTGEAGNRRVVVYLQPR